MKKLALVVLFVLTAMLVAGADPAHSDDALYDRVRVKLAGDRDIGGENIQVVVKDGVVQLNGTVRKPASRTKAEKVARKVKGVKSVVNQLKVAAVPSA